MAQMAIIDDRDIAVTPVFKIIEVEDIRASEEAGCAMMKPIEVVEVRFAGSKNYSPVFPTDAFWKREGNMVITYAERWPDQYQAFKRGNPQEAMGTPLEMLRKYGVTPEQLSLCKALRVYSIEALAQLESQGFKALGMHGNQLREAAKKFLADRDHGASAMAEVDALRAEIAALKAQMVPVVDSTPETIATALVEADEAFEGVSDDDLKTLIANYTGSRPRGNPSRATLVNSLQELQAAA